MLAREAVSKRVLGYASWHRKRKALHRDEVLHALIRDVAACAPDHVCVTGDLTNLGLAAEGPTAAGWLGRLGDAAAVSAVPGNHDAYAPDAPPAEVQWPAWMTGDDGAAGFPYLRRRGGLAIVGVSSAVATAPFLATGRVGEAQAARLETLLAMAAREGLARVVLVHHPPQAGAITRRAALSDAPRLRAVLARAGAELVLHGHAHRPMRATLAGPAGGIPVVGVAAASCIGDARHTPAGFHSIDLDIASGHVSGVLTHHTYDPARQGFAAVATEEVAAPGPHTHWPDTAR